MTRILLSKRAFLWIISIVAVLLIFGNSLFLFWRTSPGVRPNNRPLREQHPASAPTRANPSTPPYIPAAQGTHHPQRIHPSVSSTSTSPEQSPLRESPPPRQSPPTQDALKSRLLIGRGLLEDANREHIMQGTFPAPEEFPSIAPVARQKAEDAGHRVLSPISTLAHEHLPMQPEERHYKLLIGINTIPRIDASTEPPRPLNYLMQTLNSLKRQLDHLPAQERDSVLVFVCSFTEEHAVFEQAKEFFASNLPDQSYHFVFYNAHALRLQEPFADIPGNDYLSPNNFYPSHLARQQNADVLTMLATALRIFPQWDYFLTMEDDFLACPQSLAIVLQQLKKIESHQEANKAMCALRVSYGMTGLVLDRIRAWYFAHYLSANLDLLPVDVLIRKYMFDRSTSFPRFALRHIPATYGFCDPLHKILFVHQDVLLEHIGKTSTFQERNAEGFRHAFPRCGASMSSVWNLDVRERFFTRCKEKSNLSPCTFF